MTSWSIELFCVTLITNEQEKKLALLKHRLKEKSWTQKGRLKEVKPKNSQKVNETSISAHWQTGNR